MNCASARSSRASAPFSTTKRDARELRRRGRNPSCPSFSPSASCASGAKLKCGGSPTVRCTHVGALVRPLGHVVGRQVGQASRAARRSACAVSAACAARRRFGVACCRRSGASNSSTDSPRAFAAPISRDSRLRSACASCASVSSARHCRSSASTSSARGGRPRRARPRSNASGLSRIRADRASLMRRCQLPSKCRSQREAASRSVSIVRVGLMAPGHSP